MTANQTRMRRFVLERTEDVSGTSGVGRVAEGVELSCGKAVVTWFSALGCVNVYDNMKVVVALHGHAGRTQVVWLDGES